MDFNKEIHASIKTLEMVFGLTTVIEEAGDLIVQAIRSGNKILTAGNGGSAADAQHFAAEFVGRFKVERKGLPCIALTTDSSILTSVSNDYGYTAVFERQVESLGNEGDVFFGISTSGNSENIIRAAKIARNMGISCVLLLGRDGGEAARYGDCVITVGSTETPRIQEAHILIIHLICGYVEDTVTSK